LDGFSSLLFVGNLCEINNKILYFCLLFFGTLISIFGVKLLYHLTGCTYAQTTGYCCLFFFCVCVHEISGDVKYWGVLAPNSVTTGKTAMTPADANWDGRYFMNHE